MSTMKLDKQDSTYVLTLTNGVRANTLTDDVLDEFHAALDQIEADQGNAALVLASDDPKFFSNGIDLDYIQSKGMDYLFTRFVPRLDQLLLRVALLNLPTIACLTGHAYAGGALLAAAFDFRTMRADRGFLCFPEVDLKLGLSPVMTEIIKLLPNEQARLELVLTGRPMGGEEAAKRGIVDVAFSVDDLVPQTLEMAAKLAKKDRRTYAQIKHGFRAQLQGLVDSSRR
ncbi:enoyl-CoA hydratase/carnithine racemase [Chitinivorax tropicus]|uniref:Enoyl-CoA hydratase/carnithine racemase n=1 Tax=Chitinivorax tropicus TaxID=714531 RepID=A0A840MJ36_9PROT|nr:enoyl-CoA hydratase/isomerase family protein [Chitinivorax tropicus]MBB5017199.1 enoyl-CoA hydratase/carnithine racemase [Chitinivorax tropicus]